MGWYQYQTLTMNPESSSSSIGCAVVVVTGTSLSDWSTTIVPYCPTLISSMLPVGLRKRSLVYRGSPLGGTAKS